LSLPPFDPKIFDDYEFNPHKSGVMVRLRRLDNSYLFWLVVNYGGTRAWHEVKLGEKVAARKVVDYDELTINLWLEGKQNKCAQSLML
jgi:hypothetical protein